MTRTVYRRVGDVTAILTYVKQDGEWFLDKSKSTLPLSDLVNKWALEQEVEIMSTSELKREWFSRSENVMQERVSMTFVYVPSELIVQDEQEEDQATYREVRLPQSPEEIFKLLGNLNIKGQSGAPLVPGNMLPGAKPAGGAVQRVSRIPSPPHGRAK